ncbi:MAG: hypothetical protein H0U64_06665 [Gemmatimonadaceae bacterium]|nr:hypothetical protein [Gemmatimonadaceae bacterium]
MITKDQLCDAMTKECDIALHLFEKIPGDSFEYRPAGKQRNTTELLRYLSMCGIGGIRWMDSGDSKVFSEMLEATRNMKPGEFPAAMRKQKAEIEQYFSAVSEEKLSTQQARAPGGGSVPLQVAILNGPLKWLTGYKLQLFTHAKSAGNDAIGTANAWAGIDWPPPKAN